MKTFSEFVRSSRKPMALGDRYKVYMEYRRKHFTTPTKQLPIAELKRRIRLLKSWQVRASNLSVKEYQKELARRH